MKKVYLIVALQFLVCLAQAQFQWAVKGGLWAYDYGYGVVTDASNNVYVVGKYEENGAQFGTTTVTCAGNHDMFMAKYDNQGNLQWITTAGGANGDYAWGLSTDGTYLYAAGEIEGGGIISFQGSTITLQGTGDNDVFVCKYDMNGNLLWARSEGGYKFNSEKALCISNDNSGNVYIGGYFTDTTKFNGVQQNGYGGRDIFVAKYDANGAFQWFMKAGAAGRDEVKGIKADNNGNVYICGMCAPNAQFGSQTASTHSDGQTDSYLAKLSAADGSVQWVKAGKAQLDDIAWALQMDNAGAIYITGEFNSYIDFGQSGGVPTTGATNVYVAKFDASGNVQWIKEGGGPLLDRARGLGTNENGSMMYLTGQFGGIASFGGKTITAADSSDVFMGAIDLNGNWQWMISVGGPADAPESLGYESGNTITARNGFAYATGALLADPRTCSNCPTTAGILGATSLSGYDRTDFFLTAIAITGDVGVKDYVAESNVFVFPNPGNGVFNVKMNNYSGTSTLSVYNAMGQLISSSEQNNGIFSVDLQSEADGIYLLEVNGKDKTLARKKVLLQH